MRSGVVALAVATVVACDTARPGETAGPTGSSAAGSAAGGAQATDGGNEPDSPGIDIGIAGIGGLGAGGLSNGVIDPGSDHDAGLGGAGTLGPLPGTAGTAGSEPPRFVQYISGAGYSRLVFEIDSVEGMEPHAAVAQRIPERFAAILDKPDGIEVVLDDTLEANGPDFVWTAEDLDQLAQQGFDGDPGSGTIAIHVSYVDGHSESDSDSSVILGVAWGHLQIVMFKQTIEEGCGGLGLIGGLRDQACEEAEIGILTHEIGHVLGLVDNGLPMLAAHVDTEHPAHDLSPDCIMYWAYEGQGLLDLVGDRLLTNDEPLSFCQHCLDDMDAVK